MKFSPIIIATILGFLCSRAEGTSCRRPRNLRKGRYEYQTSTDYGLTQLPVNYVVRVVCDPDSILMGEEFLICQANGKWSDYPYCNAPIICIVPPESPANGYVRMRGQSARSIAVYRCNPGFQLHGKNTAVCDKTTRRWQGDTPGCFRPPSCSSPIYPSGILTVSLDPNNGIKVGDLYTERTVFNYTCHTGYHPSRDVTITCQNGTWVADADIPECTRITCTPPTLQPMENGRHDIENRTYHVGEMVQYECNEGYLVDGISWQVCQSNDSPNGIWSDSVPSCKVARCPDPGYRHLDNGRISFSLRNRTGATSSWPIGTVMTLSCSSHLELMGSSVRVCQLDGHWNGTLTSCTSEEYDCPALGNPIHGFKIGSPDYRVHSSVRFQCYHGYEMIGSEERMCTLTGEWTGEMPRCMGRDEFDDFTRVTSGLGKTFDEMAIDGGFWAGMNDTTSNSGGRRKRSIDLSSSSGLDIYFAFDASKSVGEANFDRSKKFAKLLVKKLNVNISPGGTRVGAIYYSSKSIRAFNVNEYGSSDDVASAIEELVTYKSEGTNLPDALIDIKLMVAETFDTTPVNTRKVLFIITDGFTNVGGAPSEHAAQLREDLGFKIHCIGISKKTDKAALAEVASQPTSEHVFFLSDYVKLDDAVEVITNTNRSYEECGKAGTTKVYKARIVGGSKAESGAWPWQAALYNTAGSNDLYCGGTLIYKKWILTAAHCFRGLFSLTKDSTVVYLGLTDRAGDQARAQQFDVSKLIMHPQYEYNFVDRAHHNDIALLRLDREAHLNSYVRTVCLPPSSITDPFKASWYLKPGVRVAKATGWGHTEIRGPDDPVDPATKDLMEVDLPLVEEGICRSVMRRVGISVNTTTELCAGSDQSQDSCQGDSGGPLVVSRNGIYRQIGIVSYGLGCGLQDTYGAYTRLPHFVDWVEKTIAENTVD